MKEVRHFPQARARAMRLVLASRVEGQSLWAAIESVAAKIGCAAQTPNEWLNEWLKQHQRDEGIQAARQAIDSGAAHAKLQAFVMATQPGLAAGAA
jgi:transposase-like protein